MSDTSWSTFFSEFALFRDAIATAGIAGALLGFLGVHVVLRRMVFAASVIAQAAALGVALALWLPGFVDPLGHAGPHVVGPEGHEGGGLPGPILGAALTSLLATALLAANPERLRLTRESVLGFVFLAASSGTVLIGDRIKHETHNLTALLFGTAVVVQPGDLALVTVAALVFGAFHLTFRRQLVFAAFDPVGAEVQGLPVRLLNGALFLSVGLSVALCTRALGALPVFALSILPAMTGLCAASHLGGVFAIATVLGAAGGVAGYLVSYRADMPVGATQAGLSVAVFVVTFAAVRLLARWRRRRA